MTESTYDALLLETLRLGDWLMTTDCAGADWDRALEEYRGNLRRLKAANCPACAGRGEVRQWGIFPQTVGCEDCGGTGRVSG